MLYFHGEGTSGLIRWLKTGLEDKTQVIFMKRRKNLPRRGVLKIYCMAQKKAPVQETYPLKQGLKQFYSNSNG